jgi:hypothetical protein
LAEQLLQLFDKLWGKESRELPKYPKVIGGISAFWRGSDGVKHNVSNVGELIKAYEQKITYDVHIEGKINENPRCLLVYVPAKKEAVFQVTASTEEIANEYIGYVKEMFPDEEKPIVFISYASEELALADFIRDVIARWTEGKVEVFVAKRDIPAGDNPLKIMMEDKLKHAQAIIPICSVKSKISPWLWWESAAVWAKDKKVYPLFTNISANDFGVPLTLVSQGKDYFAKGEFIETLISVCKEVSVEVKTKDLSNEELSEYKKLQNEYSKPETSAKVLVGYKKLEMTQDLHKYSFIFEVENRSKQKFDDVVIELYFPEDYIERKEWNYPHLKSSTSGDKPDYLCLIFSFSGLSDTAKKQFMSCLLPGKKLKVFGEDGMTKLHYLMDHDRWDKRFRYEVQWKVYINGGAPQEGSIPLDSIQFF